MSPLLQSLIATFLVGAISLVGVVFLFAEWSKPLQTFSLSFAAGVLLATTFLEVLPEALAQSHDRHVFLAALAAMAGFFLLERLLHGLSALDSHIPPSRYLILIGGSLHNFVDGVVIATSFAINPALGVTTTVAVATHEIPRELADYGILLSGGFSRAVALWLNFLSGLTALLGPILCFSFNGAVEHHVAWLLGGTAGMFVYIAASDIIPELHHPQHRDSWMCAAPFFGGIALIMLLGVFLPG